jgi:hypothetical protein
MSMSVGEAVRQRRVTCTIRYFCEGILLGPKSCYGYSQPSHDRMWLRLIVCLGVFGLQYLTCICTGARCAAASKPPYRQGPMRSPCSRVRGCQSPSDTALTDIDWIASGMHARLILQSVAFSTRLRSASSVRFATHTRQQAPQQTVFDLIEAPPDV